MPLPGGRRRTKLQDATLTPAYRRHLREAGLWMLGFVASLGGSLTHKTSPRWVDTLLERAVNAAHEEGEKLYWVTLAVLSIQRSFKLSGAYLRSTWSALRAWRLLQPIKPRVPITHYVLQCLLVTLLARGAGLEGRERQEVWASMLGCWLAFAGLMRPGEVEVLTVGDLVFPEAPEMAEGVGLLVSIKQAKTRRVWAHQFVIIESREVTAWLQWWTAHKPKRSRVFPVGRRKWANLVKEALATLHLDGCGLTLASFRGGGACHHFKTRQNLGLLQFTGRWRRPETLRHYLQDALAVHALANAPGTARLQLQRAYSHVHRLANPPAVSAASLLNDG